LTIYAGVADIGTLLCQLNVDFLFVANYCYVVIISTPIIQQFKFKLAYKTLTLLVRILSHAVW